MIAVNTIGQQNQYGQSPASRATKTYAYHLIVLAIVWLVIHVLLAWQFGVRNLYDANVYIQAADFLVREGRLEHVHYIFYAVPIAFIALFRSVFGGQIIPFLIFQCLISALATGCLYQSATKVFNNLWAGFFASLIFLLWWDNIHWNVTAMTESLMCSAICFLLFRLTHFTGKASDYYWIIAWLTVICLTRPTGIIILVGTIAFLLWYHRDALYASFWKYQVVVMVFVITFGAAYTMFSMWDFTEQYEKGNIVTYMSDIKGEAVYEEQLVIRSETLKFTEQERHPVVKMIFFITHNPGYVAKTGALKVWYLLSAVRPYYSKLHNTYSLVWLLSVYALFCVGWKKVRGSANRVFVLTVISVNCALIALATIDWDNRFYIPMEPGIALLAGGGAAYVLNRISSRYKSYKSNDPQSLQSESYKMKQINPYT